MFNKQSMTVLILLLFQSSFARAEVILTTVFNVFESIKTERLLVLSGMDGRIYKLPNTQSNIKLMKSLQGHVVKLTYFNNGNEAIISNIVRALPSEFNEREMDLNHFRYNELRQFSPTDLQSEKVASEVFSDMLNDGDRRRSQCFKRAHMWAYDMWSKLGINSQKIFIFYTRRYIQHEEFEWWFHVAPMVVANGKELVLDGTFMEKPISVQEWKDYFIKSTKITCPVINHYSDYENNQWQRLCYLMKVPMYYFTPLNIEDRDKKGAMRNHWVLEELQDARRAFKKYDETYEGLDTGKRTITF